MKNGLWIGAAAGACLLLAGATAAAEPEEKSAPACPAEPVLPEGLAGWAKGGSNKTMSQYRAGPMADWPPLDDRRTGLSLHKTERLTYWTPPERAADAGKYGGMITVSVEREGRLIVALDRGAWLDLVRDGTIVPSAAHGHGPACSGIRKMVEYEVTPGRYLLQISNAPESSIRAMAVMRD